MNCTKNQKTFLSLPLVAFLSSGFALGLGTGCSNGSSSTQTLSILPGSVRSALDSAPLSARDTAVVQTHTNYPALTVLLAVNDAQKTATTILSAGGRVDYDPNRGSGSSIPFLVADLPPNKILDATFITSLHLKAISVEAPDRPRMKLAEFGVKAPSVMPAPQAAMQLYIPTQDVNIPQLRSIDPGRGLGEKTIVAIIDTGVDASHPVFQDRVIYWADHTQEGRFGLTPARVIEGKISAPGYQNIAIPSSISSNTNVYVGAIDEAALSTQLSDADKTAGIKGIDLNRNGATNDRFPVLVGKDATSGEWIAYVNTSGTGTFTASELAHAMMDFNNARALKRQGKAAPYAELLRFPSEASTIAFPLLFELDATGAPAFLTVCFDGIDHGTHVAGIIGANGAANASSGPGGLVGAAPNVEIMALKVCSGITCTDQAMLRALIDAFYNPKGYIPDVVNLSIGSLQDNEMQVMDYLFRDLAQKFGATFVIANGNDGPAYRTGNSIGAFAPTIQVGAYVSKNTLTKMYTDDPGVENVPDDSLHYFTSLGPSFTGELRPNIVAPGSALSSIPLRDGGSEMMNGTSMATPMTTGSIAAMVSLARSEGLLVDLDSLRAAKTRALFDASAAAPSQYSLIGIPLTIRSSLENSARRFPGYTMPQEGYGLVQIDQAYGQFTAAVPKIMAEPQDFFQLTLNGDTASDRIYDRAFNIADSRNVQLGLRVDGELPDEVALKIETTPIEVRLESVQVQESDGSVREATAPWPFSVGLNNGQTPDPTSTTLTLANALRSGFKSIRKIEAMRSGKTYLAQYALYQNGVRVLTVMDIVHKAIALGDNLTDISVPGIHPGILKLPAAYATSDRTILPNGTHRYFVAVTARDSALKVAIGFSQSARGTLILSVNDPDGQLVGQQVINQLPEIAMNNPVSNAVLPIPRLPDGGTKTGIYEITVANGSQRGLMTTRYDLLVQSIRFKASADQLELAVASAEKKLGKSSGAVLSVMNSSREVSFKDVTVSLDQPMLMESLKPFPIQPNLLTLKRIHVPPMVSPTDTPVTTVTVDFGSSDQDLTMDSRIDNNLYVVKSGKVEVALTAASGSAGTQKVFKGVPRPEIGAEITEENAFYAAVETFMVQPTGEAAKKGFSGIDIEAVYDVPATVDGALSASISAGDSSDDVLLVDVSAPNRISNVSSELDGTHGPRARLNLTIGTASPSFQIKIPITLDQ